jgi:xanthine dehydrogenase accessory factor
MTARDASIIPRALDWMAEGRSVALATAIQTWGSAPQPVGSLLAIDGQGNFIGSVSGGCVEAEVVAEAGEVLSSGRPKTLQFGVEDGTAWKVGLACGGTIRIYLESLESRRGREADGVLHELVGDLEVRRKVALVTELTSGARSLAHSPEDLGQSLAPALAEAFRLDRSVALEGADGEMFINVFSPTIRVVIIGAVHVAQALAPMARALGYEVVVVDPRTAFATEERFGDIRIMHDWPDEALSALGLDAATAVAVLSHDAKLDDAALIAALRSESFYVGALGSKKTHAARVDRLNEAGVTAADIVRIHAPIGLDIGAQGAAEIGLSIIAEIAAVQRGKVPASQ